MTQSNFITIPINELKPGMMVHSIAEQVGNLTVKSRGRIKHNSVIKKLEACGVKAVVVERGKKANAQGIDALNQRKKQIKVAKKSLVSAINNKETSSLKPATNRSHLPKPKTFEQELEFAEILVSDLKDVFKAQRLNAEKGIAGNFASAEPIINEVFESLERNPDALLCVSMLRNNGEYLNNHSAHCAILLCYFAQQLGMTEQECKKLGQVGYLFDIGMARIPREITHKNERPTVEEQIKIQSHVIHSLEFVENLQFDNQQRLAIEQHHERLDGSGYPYGLQGEEIHKYARMLAIVDCFDAMTTNRPFQKLSSAASALKIICNPDYGYDQKLAIKFLRAVGIYPVGSAVALSNNVIAVVTQMNNKDPLKPIVKTHFSISKMDYCEPETLDLSDSSLDLSIVKPVIPTHYGIDLAKFSIKDEN